jgi:FkbM family methyltransferase
VVGRRAAANKHPLYRLRNGLDIAQINKNETEILYGEIFEQERYLLHDIRLQEGDCILDLGANIGLFTLFVYDCIKVANVYAVEPIRAIYEALEENAELYQLGAKLINCGVSNKPGKAQFTYYRGATRHSGMYADTQMWKRAISEVLTGPGNIMEEYAKELLGGKDESEQEECRLTTVSEIIREEGIGKIDLLKIAVGKSERDVLEGIKEEDWTKIKQIVIEAHDIDGRMDNIRLELEARGYKVATEYDGTLERVKVYKLYGISKGEVERRESDKVERKRRKSGLIKRDIDEEKIRAYLSERLPGYMQPVAIVRLEQMPLTASGKIDRKALPAPDFTRRTRETLGINSGKPMEELMAGFWSRLLNVEDVGQDDNFFELGGHSLLATQVISWIRDVMGVEIQLRVIFDAPTVRTLCRKIEESMSSGVKESPFTIEKAPHGRFVPLSHAQLRLFFIYKLEPASPAYNISNGVRLRGLLNVEALERGLNEIVRRYETLRSRFVIVNGEPMQETHPFSAFKLPQVNLMNATGIDTEQEARRLARIEATEPFDLEQGTVIRMKLIQLGEEDHVLILTAHHIVFDGWSSSILTREVTLLYDAYSRGEESPLPSLRIQYADFAQWERSWLQGPILDEQLSFWRKELAGVPITTIPTDRPRKAASAPRGDIQAIMIPKEVSESLKNLSRREDVTLYMTLLAAFQILLRYYAHQDDIAVGTDVANRDRAETEGLIGFFINVLVMRTDLSQNPTFKEVLKRVREVALNAYLRQNLPFDKLVEVLNPERIPGYTPLFQVKIVLQNAPAAKLELSGLTLSSFNPDYRTVKNDMILNLTESVQGLNGTLLYNADLYEASTATKILKAYETILGLVAEQPDMRLSGIDEQLAIAERRQQSLKREEFKAARQKIRKDLKVR